MCGIAGIFGAGEYGITQLLAPLKHRGRQIGFVEEDGFSLGSVRLPIVGGDSGKQPISNEDGTKHIVFNGEIYNYKELRARLEHHDFKTESDTEVILHLYEEHGLRVLNMLDGMFSFIIYDSKTGDFLAARDHIGIKPLYYTTKNNTLYFASEKKSLTGINASELKTIPPGHYIQKSGLKQYYTAPSLPKPADKQKLKELVTSSVLKMCGCKNIGVFLSGGLDSSLVAKIASQRVEKLKTFTVGFEGSQDLEKAELVAQELGTEHHTLILDEEDILKELPKIIWHLESFNSNLVSNAIPTYFCSKLASKHTDVVLCGEGSDELFAGYDSAKLVPKEKLQAYLTDCLDDLHKSELQRVDRCTSAFTIEARVPFLDKRLMEYASNIPADYKLKNGVEKHILRESFKGFLPEEILWRKKMSFATGSGMPRMKEVLEKSITDAEFQVKKDLNKNWKIENKEMLHYFEQWKTVINPLLEFHPAFTEAMEYPVNSVENLHV